VLAKLLISECVLRPRRVTTCEACPCDGWCNPLAPDFLIPAEVSTSAGLRQNCPSSKGVSSCMFKLLL